jgi:agmatinase
MIIRLLLLVPSFALAREITFPPVSGFAEQQILGKGEDIDIITGSAFAGLTTYANLPYVHCLAANGEDVEKFDIAILGAPFDTVGCFCCFCCGRCRRCSSFGNSVLQCERERQV